MANPRVREHQVVFLCEFGTTDTISELTTDEIAKTFNIRGDKMN
jgi:hypothetical protein